MADKIQKSVRFEQAENGFIISQDITVFDSNGEWKSSENKKFVSTTASGTKKLIAELTDDMKDGVKGNDKSV